MKGLSVYLVGNTPFAENVTRLLRANGQIEQVEYFRTMTAASQPIQDSPPDVLILADVSCLDVQGNTPCGLIDQEIPIIFTDYENTSMKVVTTTRVPASLPNLINSIVALDQTKRQLDPKLIHPEVLDKGEMT